MVWKIFLKESVIRDLRWFGKRDGRLLLKAAIAQLEKDPTIDTKNLKTLRPNRVAQRELRLLGRFRVLFNVDESNRAVTIIAIGEKRGATLLIQGKEFTAHESDLTQ